MATLTEAQMRNEVEKAYKTLDARLPTLLTQCDDGQQQRALMACRDALRDAFFAAQVQKLLDANPIVEHIFSELKSTENDFKQELQDIQSISQVIALGTELAKLAGALVTLAAA
ncbi:hypothetical protein [Azospirillum argentinense]|uniref:Uncharacterized protein n=1 Tax=Azospirillum argentinense TaxID=2970906 RepID=A0A5B0KIN1_9PROT|nr:hypothetical protein [Azospirillum argentinense]KAA1052477.1 hypothetical protein FH063_004254 [Azospirillum argentinense]